MSKWKETDFGKIPINWELKRIIDIKSDDKKAIAMGPFGSNIKAENFVETGVPVIRGTNLNYAKYVDGDFVFLTEEKANELIGSNCKAGDLVFTHRGTIGQVCLIPPRKYSRYVISQSGMKLTVNPELINNEFLFYFFKSEFGQYQILKYEAQVGVPSISNPLTSLKEMQIPVPNISEQIAIASVLSCLDDKIDLLHRQNATLEKMAETLFRQWFVEEAKEDWEEVDLEYVTTRITDGAHHSPITAEFGLPMASVKDMFEWGINIESCRKISKQDYDELVLSDCRPLKNDIIIAKDGSYLKHVFVAPKDLDVVILSSIAILRPNGKYDPILLSILLKLDSTIAQLENIVSGAVIPRIVLKDFRKFKITLPPYNLQTKALNQIKPLYEKCWINVNQIQTLTTLRDTLLPKLMSGEIRLNCDNND